MSDCTHDCSSCSADCASRDLRAPANAKSSIKRVIAVVSGKGGVGKSTVTASLAAAMAKRGRKVAVLDSGDSDFLPGRQVNRFEFEKVANDLIAEGKEPPVGQPLLLGITVVTAVIVFIGNLIADLLYGAADPRIRKGAARR